MSQRAMRRIGALMSIIVLLSVVLVPAAAASPATGANASAAQSASCPVYYRVVRGDNLTRIGYRYGVSVAQLMRWNNIWNADRIYVGQVLVIWPYRCTHPVPPPPPPPPPPPSASWRATYYNSRDLTGPIVLERAETRPCANWGWGSPAPQVMPDNFSVRWTTTSNAVGGTYRISVKTDDGARLYIDGVKVLDAWREQAVSGYFVDVIVPRGWHTWTIEYFEQGGVAEFCYSIQKL